MEDWLIRSSERPRLWLAAFSALLAMQISAWWYPAPDAITYLSIARSLVTGAHVGRLGSHQLGFPPGYPLLISPAFLIADRPFLVLSIMHWIMGVLLMLGVFVWARRQCPAAALLITGLVMVNVSVWNHYRRNLSELAFMTVAVWTVNVLNRVLRTRSWREALHWALPASGLMVLLGMIREVGAVFGAGFAAALLIDASRGRRRWSAVMALSVLVALPAAVAVLGFARYDVVVAERSVDQAGTHWDGFVHPKFEGRIAEGVRLRMSDVGRLTVPGMFKAYSGPGAWLTVDTALYALVCMLVGIGWWKWGSRQWDVFALTVPFYLAVYVVWPFDGATRYAVPVLPVLLACVWFMLEAQRRWRLSVLAILLVMHLCVAIGYWVFIDVPRTRECNSWWVTADQLAGPIRGSTQPAVAAHVPDCLCLMLDFILDRPVGVARDGAPIGADVGWMITPEADPVPAGFRTHSSSPGYKLLAREHDR